MDTQPPELAEPLNTRKPAGGNGQVAVGKGGWVGKRRRLSAAAEPASAASELVACACLKAPLKVTPQAVNRQ